MEIFDFQKQLFALGEQQGFVDMELYYEHREKFGCRIFEGEVDNYESSEVAGISFRGLYNGKMGYAFTEKISEDSMDYLLENAKDNAGIIDDEEGEEIFAGSESYRDLSFYAGPLDQVTISEIMQFGLEVEKKILAFDKRVKTTNYFMLSRSSEERQLINSKGLQLFDKQNYFGMYVSVVVEDAGQVKTGSYECITKDFHSLNADEIAEKAAKEALDQLGSRSISNKNYPVILRNDMAATMLQTFSQVFSAENVQKGRSRLKDRIGTKIGVSALQINDDPFLPEGIFSRTFDGEGVAAKELQVVKDGQLLSLLHNRKTAKKAQTESTGHAYKSSYKDSISVSPSNFYIGAGEKSLDEMISMIHVGVLITDLTGLHSGANSVSGQFSLAAKGFYIVDGKVRSAVNQMTIAGDFFELINAIEVIGNDLEFVSPSMAPGYFGSPSLLVSNLSVTVD